jgi:hypothetical protein
MSRFESYLILNKVLSDKYKDLIHHHHFWNISNHIIRINEIVGFYEAKRILSNEKLLISNKCLIRVQYFFLKLLIFLKTILGLKILTFIPRLANLKSDLDNLGGPMVANSFNGIIYKYIATRLDEIRYFNLLNTILINDFKASDIIKFEIDFEKLITELKDDFSKLRIKVFISQNFHTCSGVVLALALNRTKIMSVEIAHAYTQDPYLITILPKHSNISILWTNELVEEVNKVENSNSVIYLGYPNLINQKLISKSNNEIILLLFPALQAKVPEKRMLLLEYFDQLFEKFVTDYPSQTFLIRCHPGDKTQETNTAKKKYIKYLSNNSLSIDLNQSILVLGGSSSVLIDAYYNNILAMQLLEFDDTVIHSKIERISICEIHKINLNELKNASNVTESEKNRLALNLLNL